MGDTITVMEDLYDKNKMASMNRACERFGSNQLMFSEDTKNQMLAMVSEVKINDPVFAKISGTAQSRAVQAGFAAETAHKETFNLDAMLKDNDTRAITDNDLLWYLLGYKKNDNPDILVVDGNNEVVSKAQLKYYKNGKSTANALREIKDGQVKYQENDQYLVASDKVKTTIAAAKKTNQWEKGKTNPRESVVDATQQVQDKTTAQLKADGVESRALSAAGSKEIARNGTESKVRKAYINEYEMKSTLTQMGKAGIYAAVIAAITSSITNTVAFVSEVRKGNITPSEAVAKIAGNTTLSSADAAIKASLGAGAVSQLVRQEIIGGGFKGSLASGGVLTSVGIGVDFAKDIVLCATGNISTKELKERTSKNMVFSPVSLMGSAIGTNIATSLGLDTATAAIFGGIPGGMIVSIALSIAIENGIEKPFRELLMSQEHMMQGMALINQTLQQIDVTVQMIDIHVDEAVRTNTSIETKRNALEKARAASAVQQNKLNQILEDF